MKILVCISSVPDTTSKINFTADGKALDKNGIQFVINPYDEFSLTRAIWLQEKQGATVTVLTVGDASTESVLRKALAMGANDGIRVDADARDDFYVASQIAAVAKNENYNLIFTGKESIDYNGQSVPGMLAAMLDIGFVNGCIGLEVEGSTATAIRESDAGKETLQGDLPLVIAGQKGLVEETDLRIPNMRGIMQARTKKVEVVSPIDVPTKTSVLHYEKPPARGDVTLVDADNVEELVRLLREEAKAID